MLTSFKTNKNSLRKCLALAGLFSLVLFCIGCQKEEPPSDNFIETYIELRIATELYGTRPEAGLVRRDVLKKHGYTADKFNAEADRIRADYNLWLEYEKRVLERIDSLTAQHTKQQSEKNKASSAHAVEQQHHENKQAEAEKKAAELRTKSKKKPSDNPRRKR